MDQGLETSLEVALRDIVAQLCPDATYVSKYGGQLIEAKAGDPRSQIGGYFFYNAHMSLEFTQGASLSDPDALLQGKGKYRRHLKIRQLADLQQVQVATFLQQALDQLTEA